MCVCGMVVRVCGGCGCGGWWCREHLLFLDSTVSTCTALPQLHRESMIPIRAPRPAPPAAGRTCDHLSALHIRNWDPWREPHRTVWEVSRDTP